MTEITARRGKVTGYALVRGPDGRPVFDDPNNIPDQLLAMLTDAEREEYKNDHLAFSRVPK